MKKADECVVYHDDGWYCSWSKTQKFNFDLIAKTKAEADGLVLLVTEEEAEAFNGEHYDFDNHESWILSKPYIWMIYKDFPKDHWETEPEDVKRVIRFLRSCII